MFVLNKIQSCKLIFGIFKFLNFGPKRLTTNDALASVNKKDCVLNICSQHSDINDYNIYIIISNL